MKKVALSVGTALVFFVAMAVAQSNPQTPDTGTGSQGTESSSPSMSGSQNNGTMGQTSSNENMKGSKGMKEHTIKGCIENENGSYVLETSHDKDVALTGADVSGHTGHEVKLHGTWENGGSAMSSSSSGSMGSKASSGKMFNVTSVDMISETCKMGSKKSSGTMGSSSGTTNPPQK